MLLKRKCFFELWIRCPNFSCIPYVENAVFRLHKMSNAVDGCFIYRFHPSPQHLAAFTWCLALQCL